MIGKIVADGKTEVPGRVGIKAGTVLYEVLWEEWPPELGVGKTWEMEDDIPCGEVDFVALYEAMQEAVEVGETEKAGSDTGSEDEM